MGLTRPTQPLERLPDDFTFRKSDIPREVKDDSAGRALPREILNQLCERLPLLQTCRRDGRHGDPERGRHVRIAMEVLIDTGRRPDEVQKLPWDCLHTDDTGKYVLIYTDFKNNRRGCRLPVPDSTAALITEQKNPVRDSYPDIGNRSTAECTGLGAVAGVGGVGDPSGERVVQAGGVLARPADVAVGAYEDGAGGEFGCRVGSDDEGDVRAAGQLGWGQVAQ
jgi:hypothetical protein